MTSHHVSKFLLTLLVLSLFATNQAAKAQDSDSAFTVTIHEEAGIPRRSEPTKVSLPFAAGELDDEKNVALFDVNGNLVPTQFEVLARWTDDSIRWLLAHFLADVPAHGQVNLTIRRGSGSSRAKGEDLVREQGENYLVDTGVIRVEVGPAQRDGFWVTDDEGQPLLTQRPQLVVYSPTGTEYRSAPPDQVELEVNGPGYASMFLAGPMRSKDSKYDKVLRWETRLHFWKGLAQVLAEHTLVAMGAAPCTAPHGRGYLSSHKPIFPLSALSKGQSQGGAERLQRTRPLVQRKPAV